jgi:ribosomal protein S18 acetylase RimI-like enzyme
MFEKNKIKIRKATIKDIPQILEVEKAAWEEEKAATREMFESRIKTFPEGTLVALIDKKIVGVIVTEIINYNSQDSALSWYEVTDNGFIAKTHNPKGDTLYGVDLSVHPSYQNKGIGKKLLANISKLAIQYNLKQGVLGSRIPNYNKFADKIKVEDYVKINNYQKNEKNIPPDPELSLYRKCGFRIIKIIPEYFKDPESLNYGVLLIRENPFHNKWYRWIIAKIFNLISHFFFP